MLPTDRLGDRLRASEMQHSRLLVLYVTLGDPVTTLSPDIAVAAVEAGADVLEVGIPTPHTAPRGSVVADSFLRAGDVSPDQAFAVLRELRDALPSIPLLPLIYPETVADLEWKPLIQAAVAAGADGLVLTAPADGREVEEVVSNGLTAIPVVRSADDVARRAALEAAADLMTYRTLAPTTGGRLDQQLLATFSQAVAKEATKPFLAGFGIAREDEIRAASRHAAGVVIGSELHRILLAAPEEDRIATMQQAVRAWKDATRSEPGS